LTFNPSKFVTVCEPTTITVMASSPDGLSLTYSWALTSTPATDAAANAGGHPVPAPGVANVLTPNGNQATFDTATPGDYSVTVTVTDSNGHSASLTFPVHVLQGTGCAPVPRSATATTVQTLFSLAPSSSAPAFTDVAAGDPLFAAVQAVSPFLNRQMLCFGCALGSNFLPNAPSTRGEEAVLLTTILVSNGSLTLLSPSDAQAVLATYSDGASVPLPAQQMVATALKGGVLEPLPGNQIGLGVVETSADSAAMISHVSAAFGLGGAP
jgi:hypothetical protein